MYMIGFSHLAMFSLLAFVILVYMKMALGFDIIWQLVQIPLQIISLLVAILVFTYMK